MLPHESAYRHRKPIFIGTTLLGILLDVVAPSQPVELRLAAPMLALVALVGGFLVGWLPLRFQALLWARVAPRVLRVLCLTFFYLFLFGTLLSIASYPFFAEELNAQDSRLARMHCYCPRVQVRLQVHSGLTQRLRRLTPRGSGRVMDKVPAR